MSIFQVLFSADFIFASLIYCMAILIALPLFAKIHETLDHQVLQWPWDHIGMPLLRAMLILLFVLLAYPGIFSVNEAPSVLELLTQNEGRISLAINILFVVTLLIPIVPVIGNWEELILPVQAMTASALVFTWLAAWYNVSDISYWPGAGRLFAILLVALATHWLAVSLSGRIGTWFDERFHVHNSAHLVTMGLVLVMQSPAIIIYSLALGRQLA